MLLRAFFLIFLISIVSVSLLTMTALGAKAVLYHRALGYLPAGYQLGLATIAQSFAGGTYVAPTPGPAVCVSNDVPCNFFTNETVRMPAQTAPSASASCAPSAFTNCATNLQKQVIDETRLGLQMDVTILDANKNPLVTRTKFLTLRTFGVPPYFALTGERDGAMGDRSSDPEGENAGVAPGSSQSSTQITVLYHDTTGKNPDREHDTWATQGWNSANGSAGSWSP